MLDEKDVTRVYCCLRMAQTAIALMRTYNLNPEDATACETTIGSLELEAQLLMKKYPHIDAMEDEVQKEMARVEKLIN